MEREKTVIVGVPEGIRFCVRYLSSLLSSLLFIMKISLRDQNARIEFLRFESLKELDGMESDGGERREENGEEEEEKNIHQ